MGQHIKGGGIEVLDNFKYSGQRFLDQRKECQTIEELVGTDPTSIPDGFTKYVHDNDTWYRYHSDNEELEGIGRWRSILHGREVLSPEFLYAIVDANGTLLWGIRHDGSTYQPRGIPEEVQARFDELAGWQLTDNDEWLFGIADKLGNLLFGIDKQGKLYCTRGMTFDGEQVGIDVMDDDNYLFAINDRDGNLLFGIDRSGAVVYNKGMSDEVRSRFEELRGIKTMKSENWLFAICDSEDQVLAGIRPDGEFVIPRGIIEVVTWEEYEKKPQDSHVLYLIEDERGALRGAYYKGRMLNTGEEYNFLLHDNVLVYRGKMNVLPKIGINHKEMTLEVEYPSDYEGPIFENVDGLLMLR